MGNNQNGIIASFDADTLCEANYLIEIENHFNKYPETNSCTVYFEHPTGGTEFSENIYHSIIQYELYLRYYKQALQHTTFPYVCHSVGSCMVFKASLYTKQGGMNRKQAGEDFYFMQKIVPLGNFYEII